MTKHYMDSTGLINSEEEWINKYMDGRISLSKLKECVEVKQDKQGKKWKPIKGAKNER